MNKKIKKSCVFYASDYHFEMIILPYVLTELENKNNVLIISENDLSDSIRFLLGRMNLTEEENEKVLNLDWGEFSFKNFNRFSLNIFNKNVIFIKGSLTFVNKVNKRLKKITDKFESDFLEIQVVDCYDFVELSSKKEILTKKYDEVLGTKKIKRI